MLLRRLSWLSDAVSLSDACSALAFGSSAAVSSSKGALARRSLAPLRLVLFRSLRWGVDARRCTLLESRGVDGAVRSGDAGAGGGANGGGGASGGLMANLGVRFAGDRLLSRRRACCSVWSFLMTSSRIASSMR